ncbi:unnamed protein product [Paramecium sonneborni]|uniref:Uncharacterized protein n=1 Tax=Paramecium sonneborni TaxID=65129 RepID=A0A8S1K9U3_9CILI|nr:unnamed protein product [Paramecium sonneborni]
MNSEISRAELLQWVNDLLKITINKIEQLGTGAIYCQLIDAVHPGKIQLNKVNWRAKQEYEFVNNFKILQQSFTKLGLQKPIEIEKLTKCKYQDNLEFLQWMKKYIDTHFVTKDYDPLTKRGNQEFEDPDKQIRNQSKPKVLIKNNAKDQQIIQNLSKNSSFATIQILNNDFSNKENRQASMTDLLLQIETLKCERDFYYLKLKDLDGLMEQHLQQGLTADQLCKGIKEILYNTHDRSIVVQQNGDLEVTYSENNEDSKSEFCKTEQNQPDDISIS